MLAKGELTLLPSLCPFPQTEGRTFISRSFLTPPKDLSATLSGTNGTQFQKFLDSSGILGALLDYTSITVFALTDAVVASVGNSLTKSAVGQNVMMGFVGYTPDLVDGNEYGRGSATGGKIKVTINGGAYFVNNVRIVSSDVIMKNGVVHYVENVSLFIPLWLILFGSLEAAVA